MAPLKPSQSREGWAGWHLVCGQGLGACTGQAGRQVCPRGRRRPGSEEDGACGEVVRCRPGGWGLVPTSVSTPRTGHQRASLSERLGRGQGAVHHDHAGARTHLLLVRVAPSFCPLGRACPPPPPVPRGPSQPLKGAGLLGKCLVPATRRRRVSQGSGWGGPQTAQKRDRGCINP